MLSELSEDHLYLLPFFKEESVEQLYKSLQNSKSKHMVIDRRNQSMKNAYVLKPTYNYVSVDTFQSDHVYAVPHSSHETLAITDGENLRRSYIHVLMNQGEYGEKENPLFSYNNYIKNEIPVLTIKNKYKYSIDHSHIQQMGKNQQWIDQLVDFFKDMTTLNIQVDPEITYDCFLFNRKGAIEAFITYDLLDLGLSEDPHRIRKHNLSVFYELIHNFQSYTTEYAHVMEELTKDHDSKFNRLHHALQRNDYLLSDFESIKKFMNTKDYTKIEKNEIGVFLDTANIFTGLQQLEVDFHHLFTKVFGTFHHNHIKDQYATIFYPEYEDPNKTVYAHEKIDELKQYLERQGFTVLETQNGKSKAKEFIDGQERDVDDHALIQKMIERKDKYHEFLVFTGDDHFHPIARQLKEGGWKVNIISVSEEDTSPEILETFKGNHSYITDYWECFNLY